MIELTATISVMDLVLLGMLLGPRVRGGDTSIEE